MTPSRRCNLICARTAAALALLLAPISARAQPAPPTDPTAAEALFKRGRALVEASDFAAACPKFEASFAASPSVGALLNIARCHEREGKPATAYRDYARALELNRSIVEQARRKAVEGAARQAMDQLEPRLPRLRISAPEPPPGLAVTCDGAAVPPGALDQALPLDPGSHQVTASAPGHAPVTRRIVLEEGKTTPVILTLLRTRAPVAAKPTEEWRAPAAPVTLAKQSSAKASIPTWVWAAGGAGLAMAGAGAFFLADDLAAIRALQENCTTGSRGTQCKAGYDYQSDNARKNRALPLAIGLGGAGLAALGAAVVGITMASSRGRPAVAVSPWLTAGSMGAGLSRSW